MLVLFDLRTGLPCGLCWTVVVGRRAPRSCRFRAAAIVPPPTPPGASLAVEPPARVYRLTRQEVRYVAA